MYSLSQQLGDLSLTMLEAIAQRQGLETTSGSRETLIAAILAAVRDAEHRSWLWRSLSSAARQALMSLDAADNHMPVATFQRRFGEIRKLGDVGLQQEQPWIRPQNPAEELWYAGYLLRGFQETDKGMVEMCSIPAELLPLPETLPPATGFRFAAMPPPAPAPDAIRYDADMLLEDMATLLIYARDHRVWLNAAGRWRDKDRVAVQAQWRRRPGADDCYFDLVLHCARRQGLLTRRFRQQQVPRQALQSWLQRSRYQQAMAAFIAWRDSPHWRDLCRTPGLVCDKGNWHYDAVAGRMAVLAILQQGQPWQWRRLPDLIAAIYEQQPDFLRPDGNYHTWYVREAGGEYLHGFENWHQVEGRVLGFLWQQPLHYLGVIAWNAEGELWALSDRGYAWLHNAPEPELPPAPAIIVSDDFYVELPPLTPLVERFRVARFAFWQASTPHFRYRITQRSLKRAARWGISPQRIARYLARVSQGQASPRVLEALNHFRTLS